MPSIAVSIVIAVAIAELIACSVIEVSGHAYVAHDRLRGVAILRTLLGGTRVAALVHLMVSGASKTLAAWAPLYLLSTGLVAAVALIVATRAFGFPERTPMRVRELGRGLPFAFGAASAEVQDDIDKTLLVRFGFLAEAGVYAVAYRVVSFVFLPVRALLFASYASFFPRRGGRCRQRARSCAATHGYPAALYLRHGCDRHGRSGSFPEDAR